MGSAGRRQKNVVCTLSCWISTFIFLSLAILFFYVHRNNNVLCLCQYHLFVAMDMLLLTQSVEVTSLFLRQTSKVMTWVLRYFHMLAAFFLQIVAGTDVKDILFNMCIFELYPEI
jgi:hypothetical protein